MNYLPILERKNTKALESHEQFSLIYLGLDYFTIRFAKEKNMNQVLQNGL